MLSHTRINQYRTMWLYVFFDLPTESKQEVKVANHFRKFLLKDGFTMFQYSIYLRSCASRENALVHEQRIKRILPKKGKVAILTVTDRQFGKMKIFHGKKKEPLPIMKNQLELF